MSLDTTTTAPSSTPVANPPLPLLNADDLATGFALVYGSFDSVRSRWLALGSAARTVDPSAGRPRRAGLARRA